MKKTTRKSFSRKAIVVVMCVFLTISLTAVGFASWLISNDASTKVDSNVNASNVSDAILGVTIKDPEKLGKINFGPLESDTEGNIRYNAAEGEANDKESLTITLSGSIDRYQTLATMYITVKCPDSVLTAAGYTWTGEGERTYTYNKAKAYIALPSCAVDTNGKVLPLPDGKGDTKALEFANGNEVFTGSDANKKDFTTTISFKWGALFEGNNPGRYLDGEGGLTLSEENKTALLAIINVGKAEGSKYTTLAAKGDAEAKRDILRAMKVAITGANSYEEAEKATAPQFTVVVNAKAK